uniref:Uncharacterized protein n=1 Tax=Anguilla anguilla TaxID=7936 RepID=A0A0E9R8I3_ANGAN
MGTFQAHMKVFNLNIQPPPS